MKFLSISKSIQEIIAGKYGGYFVKLHIGINMNYFVSVIINDNVLPVDDF